MKTTDKNSTSNRLRDMIYAKISARSTENIKNDAKTAMKSNDHGSTLIFVTAMDILEQRLSADEYSTFEDSL